MNRLLQVLALGLVASTSMGCSVVALGVGAGLKLAQGPTNPYESRIERVAKALPEAEKKNEAKTWREAERAASDLAHAVREQKEKTDFDQPAHDLARDSMTKLFAMPLDHADFALLDERFDSTFFTQADPELAAIAKPDESFPKLQAMMQAALEKEGGVAGHISTKEVGLCYLTTTEDTAVALDDGEPDEDDEPASAKAKGARGKRRGTSARASIRERKRSHDEATPEPTPPQPTTARAPVARPMFVVTKKTGSVAGRCKLPEPLRSYKRSEPDSVVVSAFFAGGGEETVRPTRITPDMKNLDATELAFELPLPVVTKTFAEGAEKHGKATWGLVRIDYVTRRKVGESVQRSGSGVVVSDNVAEHEIATGTFVIKLD